MRVPTLGSNFRIKEQKIPASPGFSTTSDHFDLLLRRCLRALYTAAWARACSSTDALNIDRGIRLVGVIPITRHLHGFSDMLRQRGRIGVRRNIQLVGGASFVRNREIRGAAAQAALGDRRFRRLAGCRWL